MHGFQARFWKVLRRKFPVYRVIEGAAHLQPGIGFVCDTATKFEL